MINHLRIRPKLLVLVLFMTAGTVLAVWLALYAFHQDMLQDRRNHIASVTRLMANELGVVYRGEAAPALSREERTLQLREMIHSSRYGDNDYFFLYKRSGVLVAHAVLHEREGQNLLAMQNADGRYLVQEMVHGVEEHGVFFWDFRWPRPGETEPAAKLGYAMAIPGTDLIVGTGIYLDTLEQAYLTRLKTTVGGLSLLLIGLFVLALMMARSISRPVMVLSEQMRKLAKGDLQQTIVATERKDEIGTMARAVRRFHHQAVENRRLQFMQDQTRFRNDFDPVTQLPRRQAVNDAIEREVIRQVVCPEGFAVLCIRLHNLREITLIYGEQTCDRVLVQLTRRLFSILHVGDVLARSSDDALCLLLPNVVDEAALESVCEKLWQSVVQSVVLDDVAVELQCAMGSSCYPRDGDQGYQLLGQAEIAASHAHQQKLKCVSFDSLEENTDDPQARLWHELQEAVEQDQFTLQLQPIYRLDTGDIVSVEVLLRWMHPERGWINPVHFIPQAEKNGMICRIDRWVLEATIRQIRDWLADEMTLPRFSVNISGISFLRYDLPELVQSLCSQYEVPLDLIELELTEGVLIDEFSEVREQMERAQALGITIAIDDFGTGYSSISRIRNLAIDTVKIDRAFVQHMVENQQDLKLVEAIIHMSHGLGLSVVAEGVETTEQLNILRNARCDRVQGFLLSKPMDAADFAALVQPQFQICLEAPEDENA